MRLTILGSGTLLPDDDHHSPAHLLEDGGSSVLLDCGSGTVHGFARHGVDWTALDHVVLTHFHTDHVGDLPALLWALRHGPDPPRERPLTVLGPPGLRRFIEALTQAHGEWLADPPFPLEVRELARRDQWIAPDGAGRLRTTPTPHTEHSVAVRWDGSEGSVGYTGDTGEAPEVAEFLEGVHLLVAECAVSDEAGSENHLTPRTVGDLAARVAPEVLVLTHLYPGVPRAGLPDLVAGRGYTGVSAVARDGLVVEGHPGAFRIRGAAEDSEDR